MKIEQSEATASIISHYTVGDLEGVVLDAFEASGTDTSSLDIDALGRIDGFHLRGRESTHELIELVGEELHGTSVIDVGSGIGGTARVLAQQCQCDVTGVDLTEEYCTVATSFSARVGLAASTRFVHASATDLPFHDETFDVGWTEHCQMNVVDKLRFYGELRRVVRPGGLVAFHDIFSVDGEAPDFPVPWAETSEMNDLITIGDLRALLAELDLEVEEWVDCTEAAVDWIDGMRQKMAETGPPPVGIHLLMGATAPAKIANMRAAFGDRRICAVQAVLRRV